MPRRRLLTRHRSGGQPAHSVYGRINKNGSDGVNQSVFNLDFSQMGYPGRGHRKDVSCVSSRLSESRAKDSVKSETFNICCFDYHFFFSF